MPVAATNPPNVIRRVQSRNQPSPTLGGTLRKRRRTLALGLLLILFALVHHLIMTGGAYNAPRLLLLVLTVLLAVGLGFRQRWARWVGIGFSAATAGLAGFAMLMAISAGHTSGLRFVWLVTVVTLNIALCAYLALSRGLQREIRRAHRQT